MPAKLLDVDEGREPREVPARGAGRVDARRDEGGEEAGGMMAMLGGGTTTAASYTKDDGPR